VRERSARFGAGKERAKSQFLQAEQPEAGVEHDAEGEASASGEPVLQNASLVRSPERGHGGRRVSENPAKRPAEKQQGG